MGPAQGWVGASQRGGKVTALRAARLAQEHRAEPAVLLLRCRAVPWDFAHTLSLGAQHDATRMAAATPKPFLRAARSFLQ